MKHNNKLPYRERVRHAAYRDTYTQRSEEIQIRKEIKRMEKDKAPANEPPLSEKERTMNSKQSAWISVDERLPEDDAAVLGIVRGKYRNVEYHDAMELVCYFEDEGDWALWSDASVTIQVTHWMPLPEPPKGAGNDKQTHGS